MFDFVRNNTRLMLGLLVLLIIPSFIFFGIEGYSGFNSPENQKVASVDGQKVSQVEWDSGHRQQVENLRRQMPSIDAALLDGPAARYESLEQLIRQRVLLAVARQQHLAISDAQLQSEILANPQLSALRKADGSVDLDAYRALLSAQGYTPESYEAALRQELLLGQVLGRVGETTTASPSLSQAALRVIFQERSVRIRRFQASDHLARMVPTEEQIQAFYDRNQALFQTPEQADIEYVVLDAARFGQSLAITEDELRKSYQDNLALYTQPEERRASHILIKVDKGASAQDKARARARSQALRDEVAKSPARFAEVAKAQSEDPGSAAMGGDLDFFGRGAMVKGFEEAVFGMELGQIVGPVETEFGFHVIQLKAVRGGKQQAFEAVRAQIEAKLRQDLGQRRFTEAAEQFTNMVYEQSDSLKAVAERFKLTVARATVGRSPQPGAQGALASAKLLTAIYADDSLRNKRNTDAVELGAGQLAAARVIEHRPSVLKPLPSVRDAVIERTRLDMALAKAREAGKAALAAAQARPAELDGQPQVSVSRPQPQGLPRDLLNAILRAPAASMPAVIGVDLAADGYVVARIDAVKSPDLPAPVKSQWSPQLMQAYSAAESRLYYDLLKDRLKAQIKVPKP